MHKGLIPAALLAAGVFALSGCDDRPQADQAAAAGEMGDQSARQSPGVAADDTAAAATATATATLEPANDSGVTGEVTFRQVGDEVQVSAQANGLPGGVHAFHVHENGDCGDNAQAAGPHMQFPTDSEGDITGNLGEFDAGDDGSDTQSTTLSFPLDVVTGKAVVVHAKGNDPESPPDGAAGERIACGVIG